MKQASGSGERAHSSRAATLSHAVRQAALGLDMAGMLLPAPTRAAHDSRLILPSG